MRERNFGAIEKLSIFLGREQEGQDTEEVVNCWSKDQGHSKESKCHITEKKIFCEISH